MGLYFFYISLFKPAYGSVRLSSAVQSLNVLTPIDSTPFFITAVFNDVQPLNAYCHVCAKTLMNGKKPKCNY